MKWLHREPEEKNTTTDSASSVFGAVILVHDAYINNTSLLLPTKFEALMLSSTTSMSSICKNRHNIKSNLIPNKALNKQTSKTWIGTSNKNNYIAFIEFGGNAVHWSHCSGYEYFRRSPEREHFRFLALVRIVSFIKSGAHRGFAVFGVVRNFQWENE